MMLLKGKEVGGHLVLIYIVSVAYLGHCIFAQLGHSDKNKRRTFLNNEKYQTRKSYWETKIPNKKRKRETKRDKRDKRCRIDTCVYWMLASEKGAPAWSTYRVHIVVVEHLVIDCSLI